MRKFTILILLSVFVLSCVDNTPIKNNIIELSVDDFKTKISNTTEWNYLGDSPAIIDFYADWCGPCKKIAPILSQLAEEYKGKINIYKVNIDKEADLANYFGITNLPTLLYITKDGNYEKQIGLKSKTELKTNIETLLKK